MTSAPSFSYAIEVAQLDGSELPDGDKITFKEVGKADNPAHVKFTLVLPQGFWWKGLVLFSKRHSNKFEEVVAGSASDLSQPGYKYRENSIAATELSSRYVVLSKAKMFGIHSNVYLVTDAGSALKAGLHYEIHWTRD